MIPVNDLSHQRLTPCPNAPRPLLTPEASSRRRRRRRHLRRGMEQAVEGMRVSLRRRGDCLGEELRFGMCGGRGGLGVWSHKSLSHNCRSCILRSSSVHDFFCIPHWSLDPSEPLPHCACFRFIFGIKSDCIDIASGITSLTCCDIKP